MYGYVLVYAETFAITLCWVELMAALRRRGQLATRTGDALRDLFPFATFLAFLPLILPERTGLFTGLLCAFLLLGVGGLAVVARGGRSRSLLPLELLACVGVAASGVLIHFFTGPRGGYLYLAGASLPLTVLWLFVFTQLIKLANRLAGLFPGLIALFSYLVIGALLTQRSVQPGAAMLAVALAGTTTCLWLSGYRQGPRRVSAPAASLWALTAAVVSVVGTSKRVAFLAMVTPLLLVAAPLIFFTVIIGLSYFGPKLRGQAARAVYQWNLTAERLVNVVMIFCLMGNLILISHLFVERLAWTVGLLAVALTVFLETARLILIRGTAPGSPPASGEVEVLGVPFLAGGMPAAVRRVAGFLDEPPGPARTVITPDALALLRSRQDEAYRSALARADLVVPDGTGVVWAGDVLTETAALERVPGIELMGELLRLAAERGAGVYLLGTRDEVLLRASRELELRYPGARVVGRHHGFFGADDEPALAEEIRASGARVLLVAMGVPLQELFMVRHRGALGVRVMVGVGGALDVLAGEVDRAPQWTQDLGLEWLHRVVREPKRLGRALQIPRFVFEVLRQKLHATRIALEDEVSR